MYGSLTVFGMTSHSELPALRHAMLSAAGRGLREGCARGWRRNSAFTAGNSPGSSSAIDTYSEQAAFLRTILSGHIVTTTMVHGVKCDTISLSSEDATGRNYVQTLSVASLFSDCSKKFRVALRQGRCAHVSRAVSSFRTSVHPSVFFHRPQDTRQPVAHPPAGQVA